MSLKINQYLEKVNEKLEEDENLFYVFRGQPSEKRDLNCTAVRFTDDDIAIDWLKENQRKLIEDIKMKGPSYLRGENQRKLYPLEILADLRHYGAPSCLIDFTSDFLIALWFACQEDSGPEYSNDDGRVFVLNCCETDKFSKVWSENIEKDIDYFIGDNRNYPDHLWYWIPERLNQRLADQDAIFVFGKPKIEASYYESIKIPKEDKKKILDELEKFFDYSRKTLFSDKYAIGDNYKKIDVNSPEYLLEESVHYIQTNNFTHAQASLEKIINSKPATNASKNLLSEAHFQLAYIQMRKTKENINKKEIKEKVKEAEKHLRFLTMPEKADPEANYIKNFNFCISKQYKEEKIKQVKEKFISYLEEWVTLDLSD